MSVVHNIFEFVNDHETTSSTGIIRRTFRRKNQNLDKLSIRAVFRFSRSLVFSLHVFPASPCVLRILI